RARRLHAARGGDFGAVLDVADTGLLGTVRAAVERASGFDAVSQDAAAAVRARRREIVDGALEAVVHVRLAVHHDLEALVVLVPADVAACHVGSPVRTARALGHAARACNAARPPPWASAGTR